MLEEWYSRGNDINTKIASNRFLNFNFVSRNFFEIIDNENGKLARTIAN